MVPKPGNNGLFVSINSLTIRIKLSYYYKLHICRNRSGRINFFIKGELRLFLLKDI